MILWKGLQDWARFSSQPEIQEKLMRGNTVMVSGGFDPVHIGHIRYMMDAKNLAPEGTLIVVVNGDGFLKRKKGAPFMPLKQRCEVLDNLLFVDIVIPFQTAQSDDTVIKPLKVIRPTIFANGGDRDSLQNVPEYQTCKELDIVFALNVGGSKKVQSSSQLIKKADSSSESKKVPMSGSYVVRLVDLKHKTVSYVSVDEHTDFQLTSGKGALVYTNWMKAAQTAAQINVGRGDFLKAEVLKLTSAEVAGPLPKAEHPQRLRGLNIRNMHKDALVDKIC